MSFRGHFTPGARRIARSRDKSREIRFRPAPSRPRQAGPPGGPAALVAAFGVAYYALAVFATALPVLARFPLFAWPADGLALGALLVVPRSRWAPFVGLAFVESLAVCLQGGMAPDASTVTALVNAVEPAIVAAVLLRLAGGRVEIGTLVGLTGFLVNLVPLAAAASLADAAVSWWRIGADFRSQWTVTFVSEFLNMAIVAPLVLAWSRGARDETIGQLRGRVAEAIVLFAGFVVATHLVVRTRPDAAGFIAPLAYICSPFLIWAALRFGLRAATLGLTVFALQCYWYTAHGLGPFAILGAADWTSLLQLQGFVATSVVTTLFAAALLAEREAAAQTTEAWRRRYEAAIRASGNLLYELDPASGRMLLDGDTRAVLGVPAEEISTLSQWGGRIHPDDRARVGANRDLLLAGEVAHVAIEYRMKRAEGEWITVGVNGYAIEDPTGLGAGRLRIIGFVSDVSERIRAEEERQALAAQLPQAEKMEAVGRLAARHRPRLQQHPRRHPGVRGARPVARAIRPAAQALRRHDRERRQPRQGAGVPDPRLQPGGERDQRAGDPGTGGDGSVRPAARLVVGGRRGAARGAAGGDGGDGRSDAPAPAAHEPRLEREAGDA